MGGCPDEPVVIVKRLTDDAHGEHGAEGKIAPCYGSSKGSSEVIGHLPAQAYLLGISPVSSQGFWGIDTQRDGDAIALGWYGMRRWHKSQKRI